MHRLQRMVDQGNLVTDEVRDGERARDPERVLRCQPRKRVRRREQMSMNREGDGKNRQRGSQAGDRTERVRQGYVAWIHRQQSPERKRPLAPVRSTLPNLEAPCRFGAPSQKTGMNITALQFGLYRDGDNNLDTVQSPVVDQAFRVSAGDASIAFSIEDTTARRDFVQDGGRRTESYELRGGEIQGHVSVDAPHDPSSRENLARFVAHTLDAAERNDARQTWVDLVDHGGGDGGGLQSDTHKSVMSSTDMAGAIADGIALHAKENPKTPDARTTESWQTRDSCR